MEVSIVINDDLVEMWCIQRYNIINVRIWCPVNYLQTCPYGYYNKLVHDNGKGKK